MPPTSVEGGGMGLLETITTCIHFQTDNRRHSYIFVIRIHVTIQQLFKCGGRFERVDDIVVDIAVDGERVVVRHLHGLRCTRCGIAALES